MIELEKCSNLLINVLNHLNFPDSTLKSFIYYKKGFIPSDLCSDIINVIKEQVGISINIITELEKLIAMILKNYLSNSKKEIDLEVTDYLELVILNTIERTIFLKIH